MPCRQRIQRIETELVLEVEDHLSTIHEFMLASGLAPREAEACIARLDRFLIRYNAFHYLQGPLSMTPERLLDYMWQWAPRQTDFDAHPVSSTVNAIRLWIDWPGQKSVDGPEAGSGDARVASLHDALRRSGVLSKEKRTVVHPEPRIPSGLIASPSFAAAPEKFSTCFRNLQEWCTCLDRILYNTDKSRQVISLTSTKGSGVMEPDPILRAERILCDQVAYERWLKRFPGSASSDDYDVDTSLSQCIDWIEQFINLPIVNTDKSKINPILERLDMTLWSLRHHQARTRGQDIRLFLL